MDPAKEGVSPLVKNRRLARMRQLVDQGEYFSFEAMEHRSPNLYHDMVGKFLAPGEECSASTRVSGDDGIGCAAQQGKTAQKTKDDPVWLEPGEWRSNQKAGKTLANVLLNSLDQKELAERREAEQRRDDERGEESEEESEEEESEEGSKMGETDQEGEKGEKVSRDEMARLRIEFAKLMRERFLQGADKEYFDYPACDADHYLDDLDQIGRDAEDAYFSEGEDEGGARDRTASGRAKRLQQMQARYQHAAEAPRSEPDAAMDY
ncbi:coiled-coil domain-containing protein-domain-containing protein [Baffinella frigidus]|nr:coiled-coil domain-containing protein-domain-containing protein [Cryptophyta sp. CCMP2293]